MHVVYRESHGLEETETPFDVGQDPADLVVLSFSDSDLGAFTAGYERMLKMGNTAHPTVRLANIIALKHPISVDIAAVTTRSQARAQAAQAPPTPPVRQASLDGSRWWDG